MKNHSHTTHDSRTAFPVAGDMQAATTGYVILTLNEVHITPATVTANLTVRIPVTFA